jgi:TatD DNase family protein
MYVDIHTHSQKTDLISIYNILSHQVDIDFQIQQFFSIGLHPWHAAYLNKTELDKIRYLAQQQNCLAIGEIGLDKTKSNNLNLQIDALKQQIGIASELNKPIIVHCVKCYSELLAVFKQQKPQGAIIFHAFNGNLQMIEMFKNLPVYFSFGSLLFNSNSKAKKVFSEISPEFVFFETDDSNYSIEEIYKQAAIVSHLPVNFWTNQIQLNFHSVFDKTIA